MRRTIYFIVILSSMLAIAKLWAETDSVNMKMVECYRACAMGNNEDPKISSMIKECIEDEFITEEQCDVNFICFVLGHNFRGSYEECNKGLADSGVNKEERDEICSSTTSDTPVNLKNRLIENCSLEKINKGMQEGCGWAQFIAGNRAKIYGDDSYKYRFFADYKDRVNCLKGYKDELKVEDILDKEDTGVEEANEKENKKDEL